jgi:hypothetical protein
VASNDDHDHADGEDQHVGVLVDDAGHVARGQKIAAGEYLEQDHDGDQRDEEADLAQPAD